MEPIERHFVSYYRAGSEGVVEDVVLLGAPVDGSEKTWQRLSRVVAGKIVNGYCRLDSINITSEVIKCAIIILLN